MRILVFGVGAALGYALLAGKRKSSRNGSPSETPTMAEAVEVAYSDDPERAPSDDLAMKVLGHWLVLRDAATQDPALQQALREYEASAGINASTEQLKRAVLGIRDEGFRHQVRADVLYSAAGTLASLASDGDADEQRMPTDRLHDVQPVMMDMMASLRADQQARAFFARSLSGIVSRGRASGVGQRAVSNASDSLRRAWA